MDLTKESLLKTLIEGEDERDKLHKSMEKEVRESFEKTWQQINKLIINDIHTNIRNGEYKFELTKLVSDCLSNIDVKKTMKKVRKLQEINYCDFVNYLPEETEDEEDEDVEHYIEHCIYYAQHMKYYCSYIRITHNDGKLHVYCDITNLKKDA